jgi:sugar phosphate isomerase/epimerase
MQIGIMDGHISRRTLEATLDAVADYGIQCMQFGLGRVTLPELPEQLDTEQFDSIRKAFERRDIAISALSGTYNMIHPDPQQRAEGTRRLRVLAAACAHLGTSVITLCTGSRDPDSMWRRHSENDSPAAWDDLLATMREAVQIAEEYNVTLAFEPEVANVVDSAQKARRLLDTLSSPHLKVCMDGANIFHTGELARMDEILDEAFALLGEDIAIAHAKDLDRDGQAGHLAAGKGRLNYDRYLSLLNATAPDVAIILHGLSEAEVGECVTFLNEKIAVIRSK